MLQLYNRPSPKKCTIYRRFRKEGNSRGLKRYGTSNHAKENIAKYL
jgi:hypothetical protein